MPLMPPWLVDAQGDMPSGFSTPPPSPPLRRLGASRPFAPRPEPVPLRAYDRSPFMLREVHMNRSPLVPPLRFGAAPIPQAPHTHHHHDPHIHHLDLFAPPPMFASPFFEDFAHPFTRRPQMFHRPQMVSVAALTEAVDPATLTADDGSCAVCLSNLVEAGCDQPVVRLRRCKHLFHKECVAPWVGSGKPCPICRQA
jgi:hypothetical protein